MADEEREHRARLRREYTRRKRLLELRKARQGESADPALDIDLEEINASLKLLDLADAPKAKPEARAAVGNEDMFDLLVAQLGTVDGRLTGVEGAVTEMKQDNTLWRDEHGKAHERDTHERRRGQRLRLAVELSVIAAAVVMVRGTPLGSSGAIILIVAALAIIAIAVLWWLADRFWR